MRYSVHKCATLDGAMGQPTSFRLPADLLERIDAEAKERSTSITALVTSLLDEGLKTRRFPGIVYRDGPAGRRAGLIGGPDVWEIVRALLQQPGSGEQRIRGLADERGIAESSIRLAVDFYAAFAEEIDERIALDDRAADRTRAMVRRREHLLGQ
jgi:hypothetical protein